MQDKKQEKKQEKKNVMLMVPLLDQGGLERICAHTANLLKDECNLCLVVFSTKNMLYDVSAVEVLDLGLGSRPGVVGKCINLLRRIKAVKRIKKERNIQVTYSFGPTANLVNAFSRVRDQIWIGIRGYGALENKHSMKLTCKRADKVICCARVMADDVAKLYSPRKVECLYNPCDIDKIRKLSEEPVEERHNSFFGDSDNIIVSMGRENDVKGFWHLIKGFALIKKELPDAKLMIIGEGEYKEYKKLAQDLKIDESVLFTGVQKNPFRYLKKCSLYIMTSITEGFPNALVEAMAVGVPVMSVNCKSGPAEILLDDYKKAADQHKICYGEYGVLLPVMNPVKNMEAGTIEQEERILAETAAGILRSLQRRGELREKAVMRSRVFSVEKYVEQLLYDIQQV